MASSSDLSEEAFSTYEPDGPLSWFHGNYSSKARAGHLGGLHALGHSPQPTLCPGARQPWQRGQALGSMSPAAHTRPPMRVRPHATFFLPSLTRPPTPLPPADPHSAAAAQQLDGPGRTHPLHGMVSALCQSEAGLRPAAWNAWLPGLQARFPACFTRLAEERAHSFSLVPAGCLRPSMPP